MNNDDKNKVSRDTAWFESFLKKPFEEQDIGPDEQAVFSAGLTDPTESELEQIIREAKTMEDTPVVHTPQPHSGTEFHDEEFRNAFGEGTNLDAVFNDNEEQEEPLDAPKKPKKNRRYTFFGLPHLLSMIIWLGIAVAIGVSLGRMAWVCAVDVLAFGKEDREVMITVTDSDDLDSVTAKLKENRLINYPFLFKLYAKITDAEEEIIPGNFTLRGVYDYNALVNGLSPKSATREEVKIMIPEGYTCAQIFSLLEEKNVCTVKELENYAAHGEFKDYWFLQGIVRGNKYCLEGYLFPDTYQFYINDNPGNVLAKMLNNFDYRFTDVMKAELDTLNERIAKKLASNGYGKDYIEDHLFTFRDIVIIASMIEKETANDAESYDVSSVIYNRLCSPNYPFLNIDATIIYALDGNIDPLTGKTKPLTSEDLQLDTPYNTYTNKGLIPGPISNPGRNSLDAALDPNDTNYYYYVYNPSTHVHLFAKNKDEHDRNVAKVRSQD